ncbi:hypothetical protein G3567_12955 [Psychroflexus sp. YR1-1]|uniref:Uncharacterized protein n=1 Tax=Psychroflexus aurantiacus TaxID=2709310 RepID=A0A6B3R325_9FLAO|nr:hypothetical protein [Psychroflexus aurantiacus]NEV95046.1 hypothetical protein [Psychroflexus aurantiacus]
MENILTFQNIVTFIFVVIYGIIFFIQKSQFKKQNEIIEKYSKIFNIIDIDEIEKYVELQKKTTKLEYYSRETDLINLENRFDKINAEVDEILGSSKSNLDKSNEIHSKLNEILDKAEDKINRNNAFTHSLNELNIKEFEEFYLLMDDKLGKLNNKKLHLEIVEELRTIQKKYDSLKREQLKKL